MWCSNTNGFMSASARVILGEVLESQGRYADAIKCAQADLQVCVCVCVGGERVYAKLHRSPAFLCLLRRLIPETCCRFAAPNVPPAAGTA